MPLYIRRILLASINAVMMLAAPASAQHNSTPAADPAPAGAQTQSDQQVDRERARQQQFRRLAVLTERLNLTNDQKRQWLQIQRQATQRIRSARRDDSLSEAPMQQKIKEIHAEQKRQLLALLTPQQQEAIKKWWEEQKQKQEEKRSDAAGPSASDKIGASEDDFFAGMVQDDDPTARPAQAQNQKRQAPPEN